MTINSARFGPDGQSVIYEGQVVPGDRESYLANTVSPESRPLGFPGATLAAVSRSGELALVFSGGPTGDPSLVRVPMNGGAPLPLDRGIWSADRSEERRVGKECRSRWSPDHLKKKKKKKKNKRISQSRVTQTDTQVISGPRT